MGAGTIGIIIGTATGVIGILIVVMVRDLVGIVLIGMVIGVLAIMIIGVIGIMAIELAGGGEL